MIEKDNCLKYHFVSLVLFVIRDGLKKKIEGKY